MEICHAGGCFFDILFPNFSNYYLLPKLQQESFNYLENLVKSKFVLLNIQHMSYSFVYSPCTVYLSACDTLDDIGSKENHINVGESWVNGSGTMEYTILKENNVLIENSISINHPAEEELDLSEFEGKVLIMELLRYSERKIPILFDEEEDGEPLFVYSGLVNSINGVNFGEEEDPTDELEEIDTEEETPETFFIYWRIENGEPMKLDL